MRIDRSAKETPAPKAVSWDNQELRNRLQGQSVAILDMSELQDLIRLRTQDPREELRPSRKEERRRSKRPR